MSRFLAYLPEAVASVWRNRTRSFLSILGMVIGIASVIAVLGSEPSRCERDALGTRFGRQPGFLAFPDRSQDDPSIATLYYRDVALLQAYAAGSIESAVPIYIGQDFRLTVSGKSEFISLKSIEPKAEQGGINVISGRLIEQDDVDSAANVGLLSESAADKLFPAGNAVGNTINVGTERIAIVGVFAVTGSLFNSTEGDSLYVPYTTAHRIVPGSIDFIQFWPAAGVSGVDAIAAVRSALARIHPRAQYTVQDQGATLGIFENILSSIGVGLTFIGGIALFVAGVGIMNIMLVSVTERTREIGIRKSIGANAGDISLQFLIEASLLSLTGGAIGTLIGVFVVSLGRGVIQQSVGAAPVPWGLVIGVAVGFSVAVGIGFGFYPAARAGQLDPVEALRS